MSTGLADYLQPGDDGAINSNQFRFAGVLVVVAPRRRPRAPALAIGTGTGTARSALVALGVIELGVILGSPAAAAIGYPPIPPSVQAALPTCLNPMTGAAMPRAQVSSTVAAIEKLAGTRLQEIGPCAPSRVAVTLAPGSEALAREIRSTYGPAVLLAVGLTAWDGHTGRSPRCGVLPSWTRSPKGVVFSLQLSSHEVRTGQSLKGVLDVSNQGTTPFQMDTGSVLQAVLVKPGTHQVVGVFSGGVAGTGYSVSVQPGHASPSLAAPTVVVGTAQCDGAVGSALTPGIYQAEALVMNETGSAPRYLSSPVHVRVTSP